MDEILFILRNRFTGIITRKEEILREQVVKELYSHLQDEKFLPEQVPSWRSLFVITLLSKVCLTGEGIFQDLRDIIGPFDKINLN